MRPQDLKTRIFLDGGNPEETRETIRLLGFLDGQTTNPTLIAANPKAKQHLEQGGRYSPEEINNFYRQVVQEISRLIPQGSVSIEVYADFSTKAEEMVDQGRKMFSWINNAHIKYPTTPEGLKAAAQALGLGLRVNMTLCFSQEQAAGVYAATRGAEKGTVYVSPFVGRLDDQGKNGMDLIANILRLYRKGNGHVEVLTASVRNLEHLLVALHLGSDIITAPFKILKEWAARGLPLPEKDFRFDPHGLKEIPYQDLDLNKNWQSFDLRHDLTTKGLESFSRDWNALIKPEAKK
jgi:transaldolase